MKRRGASRRQGVAKARRAAVKARGKRKVKLSVGVYEARLREQTVKHGVPRKLQGQLPLDSYEGWIRKQVVRPTAVEAKPTQLPVNSYEQWVRHRVRDRLEALTKT